MFLHGGLLHLGGNMLFLWVFGNNVEDHTGHRRVPRFYLLPGLVGSVGHIPVQPDSTVPVVGASGAIAGVMGAYLVLFPDAPILSLIFVFLRVIPAKWLLGSGSSAVLHRPARGWRGWPTSVASCSASPWPCCCATGYVPNLRRSRSTESRRWPSSNRSPASATTSTRSTWPTSSLRRTTSSTPAGRARLEARSPYNAVRVELAAAEDGERTVRGGPPPLRRVAGRGHPAPGPGTRLLRLPDGLARRRGPARTNHRRSRHARAVDARPGPGAAARADDGKPKDDRLSLLRRPGRTSQLCGRSRWRPVSDLLDVSQPPLARCTDEDGVHHRLWRITQPAALTAITEAVGSAPVVIADGHHRYETALAYHDERAAAAGGARGDYDLIMALVVELSDEQLQVRPIHRLLRGLPDGFDLGGALAPFFEIVDIGWPDGRRLTDRMAGDGGLGLVEADRASLLVPRNGSATDPDAARLDAALASLPSHDLAFHHTPSHRDRDGAVR